jgi:glycosyltransferase involved in cell wall biosynthesis
MEEGRGIDIVFASHNGARTLPRMLAALRRLDPPRRPWRVIAVDNASTDTTGQLLHEAAADLPLTPLYCAEPGKMPALKMGVSAVKGDLVLFTDDDVEPVPGWLTAYEAAADAQGDSGLLGGPILPTPMEDVTPWFEASRDHHSELFALSDEPDGPVFAPSHLYGPNFLIRRKDLDVLNDVDPSLGPTFANGKSRTFPMGEDSMIMDLLTERGVQARYVRGAQVRHLVRGFQTDLAFMLERAERHGRGTAIRLVVAKHSSVFRRLGLLLQNAPYAIRRPDPAKSPPTSESFNALWDAHWSRGAIIGATSR